MNEVGGERCAVDQVLHVLVLEFRPHLGLFQLKK